MGVSTFTVNRLLQLFSYIMSGILHRRRFYKWFSIFQALTKTKPPKSGPSQRLIRILATNSVRLNDITSQLDFVLNFFVEDKDFCADHVITNSSSTLELRVAP